MVLAVLYSLSSDNGEARERAQAMVGDPGEVEMEQEVRVAKEAPVVLAEEATFTSTITDIHPTMDAYPTQRIFSGVWR